jgi:hypothetical protein
VDDRLTLDINLKTDSHFTVDDAMHEQVALAICITRTVRRPRTEIVLVGPSYSSDLLSSIL